MLCKALIHISLDFPRLSGVKTSRKKNNGSQSFYMKEHINYFITRTLPELKCSSYHSEPAHTLLPFYVALLQNRDEISFPFLTTCLVVASDLKSHHTLIHPLFTGKPQLWLRVIKALMNLGQRWHIAFKSSNLPFRGWQEASLKGRLWFYKLHEYLKRFPL